MAIKKVKSKGKWDWKKLGVIRLNSDIKSELEPRFMALSGITEKTQRKSISDEIWKWMLNYPEQELENFLLEMKYHYLKLKREAEQKRMR